MEPIDEKPIPFKMGPKVWQLIAVLLLALAIPLTITIMGFKSMWQERSLPSQKDSPTQMKTGASPENPALRESLEKVAEKQMPLDISLNEDMQAKVSNKPQ